ncbi:MAG: VOC family protein [Alphaproteobacteria bacterium]|nr:VOC family protein [Alphaproteobacteria bacterium]
MRGIDHLVLCVEDLEAARKFYAALGFNLTPTAHHPFGTANSLVQLADFSFLELLAVEDASKISAPEPGHFSFGGYNRQFIDEGPGEGFSMLVLDSLDAAADLTEFKAAELGTHEPFGFSRAALLPDGEEVTVSFSLTFVTHPDMAQAAFFTCQQHAPEHFWKADYQRHANTALGTAEIIMLADQPLKYTKFYQGFAGTDDVTAWDEGFTLKTGRGSLSVISPNDWRVHFPASFAPDLDQGPRLAAFRIAVDDVESVQECLRANDITRLNYGRGVAVPPNEAFGVTIEFVANDPG